MGRKSKHIQLTLEENTQLRELEQHPGMRPKVRLRAQIIRLSAKGWTILQIAEHLLRHPETVRIDLLRWEQSGMAGLADGEAPGKTSSITSEMEQFLHARLSEERTWDCTSLRGALHEAFGINIGREALRMRLRSMGYRWKRTRYVPCHKPDPQAQAQAKRELEELKRGPLRAD
jgi:transposase